MGEILKKIFKPSAFKLGIIVTFSFFYLSYKYYTTPANRAEKNPVLNILNIAHQKSIDLRMTSRGEKPVSDQIAILAVDEDSIERFGRWPWSRDIMAKLVETLKAHQVRTVSFDIIFSEKENDQNDRLLVQAVESFSDHVILGTYFDQNYEFAPHQEVCAQIIDESSSEYSALENQEMPIIPIDQISIEVPSSIQDLLRTAMIKIQADVEKHSQGLYPHEVKKKILESKEKLCLNFLSSESSIEWIEKNWPQLQEQSEELKSVSARKWIDNFKSKSLKNPIHHAGRFWVNIPEISEKAKHYAYFNAFQDSDGYIRRTKLVARYGNLLIPSLALKSVLTANNYGAMVVLNQDPNNPKSKHIRELTLTDASTGEPVGNIPVDGEGRLNINYAGPQKMFPYISAADLLNDSEMMPISQRMVQRERFK
jgi:hypothetical protein